MCLEVACVMQRYPGLAIKSTDIVQILLDCSSQVTSTCQYDFTFQNEKEKCFTSMVELSKIMTDFYFIVDTVLIDYILQKFIFE